MLSFQKPHPESLRRFLGEQTLLPFSYAEVGASRQTLPPGFDVDRTRIELGHGAKVFELARSALEKWTQFQLGWVEAWSPQTPIQPGEVVAVLGYALGLWWLNACRIIYVIDEAGPIRRFGFAYGTLPGHVERGEERFLIEWETSTDSVTFDILAFSRPSHLLTRVGYPLVRLKQKRFGRQAAEAMYRAVGGTSPIPPIWQNSG